MVLTCKINLLVCKIVSAQLIQLVPSGTRKGTGTVKQCADPYWHVQNHQKYVLYLSYLSGHSHFIPTRRIWPIPIYIRKPGEKGFLDHGMGHGGIGALQKKVNQGRTLAGQGFSANFDGCQPEFVPKFGLIFPLKP